MKNPFKGLQPYTQEDAGTLFGRDRDLLLIQDRIFSAKTTLLFAGSGVGKTSFLNAKVIPETDSRYVICYHNQWSGDNPLHSVKISLASGLAEKEPKLKKDELLSFVENSEKRLRDFFYRYRSDRCIIILDQFEEIFQYHAYEPYFNQFLDELCEVINADDLQVRIVFSMREEFLGELSVFDNRIPDLFNNYYRLKYLDKSQAEGIIVRTCALVEVEPDVNKLQMLLNDLSKIKKVVSILGEEAKQKSDLAPREIKLDFVKPPYLQIVCHEKWNEQIMYKQNVKAGTFVFLVNYEANGAQKTLGQFCHKKLFNLTLKEKKFIAKAFDFLVPKRNTKMAYDVENLAKHTQINITDLADMLTKLTKPDKRILRESNRPDKSRWFELYHDMFSPFIYEWKEYWLKVPDLRSQPIENYSSDKANKMLQDQELFDKYRNESGKGLQHEYKKLNKNGGIIITDQTTELTWQQSGSAIYLTFKDSEVYIQKLNKDKYASFDDWRLPTLEEASSLMEPNEKNAYLFIDPIFDQKQHWIWTSDKYSASSVWSVIFGDGFCNYLPITFRGYVRAVR